MNAGSQHYDVHGGDLSFAQIGVYSFGPSSKFDYTLSVDVNGQTAKGNAHFSMQGTTPDNKKVTVSGDVSVNNMVSEGLPLGCSGTACNSAIPVFFSGTVNAKVTTDGSKPQQIQTGILLESPYFSPWGGDISIVSTDSPTAPSIAIVTAYDKATIEWTGSTTSGPIAGTLGTTAVSGLFTSVSHETENLVTGTANDDGTMTFSSMSPTTLNVDGKFSGTSVIPKAGSAACSQETLIFGGNPCVQDCTAMFGLFGLPAFPGTCTSTGLQSTGQFTLQTTSQHGGGNDKGANGQNGQVTVKGTYSTTWAQPALAFVSSANAQVSTGNSGD